MRSPEFKRTPFTDWLDSVEDVCVICGNQNDLCGGHIGGYYEEA